MDAARPAIAGIDIDGVLADPTHRLHHLQQRPKNWRGFFQDAHLDPPLAVGVARVLELADSGLQIMYVSGRPVYLQESTQTWLADNGLPKGPMHLRPKRDFRPAPQLKLQLYRSLQESAEVRVIVDDDRRVVAALRDAGFTVEFADWYRPPEEDSETLSEAQDRQGRT